MNVKNGSKDLQNNHKSPTELLIGTILARLPVFQDSHDATAESTMESTEGSESKSPGSPHPMPNLFSRHISARCNSSLSFPAHAGHIAKGANGRR